MNKELFKPNVNEDLNRLHNVTLTEGQISTILYIMEGYLEGCDDYNSAAYQSEDDTFSKDCDKIFFELEGVVDKYYAKIEEAQSKQPTPEWED